jgi:VWFA-related protein
MVRRLSALAAAGAAATLALGAEPGAVSVRQQPTFRSAVDLVDVDVSVLDRNRLPVAGLAQHDFTVLEDGKARPIVAFAEVTLPTRERPPAEWMTAIAPDVMSNEISREGRLVVILFDRTLRFEHTLPARAFAEAAIDQLRPGDLAAVVFADRGVPQNFTGDRERLLQAVRQPFQFLPPGDAGSPSTCWCGTCSLESITRVAESVQDVRQRRKMLFVISPRLAIHSNGDCGGTLSPLRSQAIRALEASNMTVFNFDPSGLETLGFSASSSAAGNYRRLVQAQMTRRGNLRILPDHTGGRVFDDAVRPADRVAEIYRESNSYYVLGFQPGSASDGKFHEIRVRVNRRDVSLQARRGYYAPGGTPKKTEDLPGVSTGVRTVVSGLLPGADLSLTAAAAPIATPDLRAGIVAVAVGVRHPDESNAPVLLASPAAARAVNVFIGAFDRNGRALAHERQTLLVHGGSGGTTGYEFVTRLTLQPGRYEVRAAVEDEGARRAGSVYAYVDVPDFSRAPISLSGLLIGHAPGSAAPGPGAVTDLVPVRPTTRRTFAPSERVLTFVRVYQGISRSAMPGYLTTELRDATDRIVSRQESRVLPEQFGASRAADLTQELPLSRLRSGEYLLTVHARFGNETARRDVRFSVRGDE